MITLRTSLDTSTQRLQRSQGPRGSGTLPRWGVWVFSGVVTALMVTGCASESGTDRSDPTPTPTQTEESASAEDLALEAYEDMWAVYVEASHSGESDPAELDRYATDQAAEHIRETLGERADAGEVARGEPVLSPEVGEVSDDEIVVDDCVDVSEWVREDAESGELIEEQSEDPVQRRVEATAEYDGLSWRVSEFLIGQRDSC